VLDALEQIDDVELGDDANLFSRYRKLVRRLIALKDAVDPRARPDEPFSLTPAMSEISLKWFLGPLQRMRYTGLVELVAQHQDAQTDFGVGLSNTKGLAEYLHPLTMHRHVGWQLQGDDLRLVVLFRERGLSGKGLDAKARRARRAEDHWTDWFDFGALPETVQLVLTNVGTKPGKWNHYDPDFVYRYRRIAPTASSAEVAAALASLTERARSWIARDRRRLAILQRIPAAVVTLSGWGTVRDVTSVSRWNGSCGSLPRCTGPASAAYRPPT
jgi:hypothetical protein